MAEGMIVGRGLVEILPDFRKWGKQLAADMKIATKQFTNSIQPIPGSFRDVNGKLRDANGKFIKEYENGWRGAAKTVGASMAAAGKGATVVGLGVGIAAVKMAGDFQKETAVLQTAAGETASGLKVVREGIKNISEGTGTGLKQLTDGMYTVEKAGFRGSKGLMVLRAAAQGAREENANLADVTNAMTSVMASYHLKATDSVRVMNAMKTAAGEGKITMEEFSGALSTVLPIASANKISLEQVAGSMATLTQHGTSAREATHELAATIRALASPNNVAIREMSRFGLSSVDVSTKLGKRGLTGTFDLLTSTILSKMGPSGKILLSAFEGTKQSAEDARIMLSKMPPDLAKVAKQFMQGKIDADGWNATVKGAPVAVAPMLRNFATLVNRSHGFSNELKKGGPAAKTYTDALKKMAGGAIGLNTILQLTGESADGNKERVKKIGESFHHASKDVEGWKITQNLLNVQLDMAKQRIQVLMVNIGSKLIPVVLRIVKLFTQHKTMTMLLVAAMLSFVAILSTAYLVTKAWAVISGIAAAAMFAFNVATMAQTDSLAVMRAQLAILWVQERLVAAWTAITSSAFWGLAAAILANPITWIVVGIAALIAGIVLLATKTKFFQTIWGATWKFLKTITLGFVHWLKSNWQIVVFTILTGPFGLAVAMIVRHWEGVKTGFRAVVGFIKKHWTEMLATLGGPLGWAVLEIVRHWGDIVKGAKAAFWAVIHFAVWFGKTLGDFFSKLPGELGRFFSSLPGVIGHWFVVAGKGIVTFFTKIIPDAGKAIAGAQTALFHIGEDLIKGFLKGAADFFTKTLPHWGKAIWDGIIGFFKAVFGIHSPSTVMAVLGVDLMRGLFVGMLKVIQTLASWLNDHVGKPIVNLFAHTIPDSAKTLWHLATGWIKKFADDCLVDWHLLKRTVIDPLIHFFAHSVPDSAKTLWSIATGWIKKFADDCLVDWHLLKRTVVDPLIHFFSSTIPHAAGTLQSGVSASWGMMRDHLAGMWGAMRRNAVDPIIHFFSVSIPNSGKSMRDAIIGFVRAMVLSVLNSFSTIIHGASKLFGWVPWAGGKLKAAAHAFDIFKDNVNKALGGIKDRHPTVGVGMKIMTGKDAGLVNIGGIARAKGGPIHGPGTETSDDVPIWASKDEHMWTAKEVKAVGGHGAMMRLRMMALMGLLKGYRYGGEIKGYASGGAVNVRPTAPGAGAINSGTNKAFGNFFRENIGALIKQFKAAYAAAVTNVGPVGSGVKRWTGMVHSVLAQLHESLGWTATVLRRMNQESGGNPNVVNRWDSNWKAGHPSVGLMQVIRGTFNAYAGRYRRTGPFMYGVSVNPTANTYAGLNYALHRYGSLSALNRPGGYDQGGLARRIGSIFKGTNQPERILSPRQTNAFERLVSKLPHGGGGDGTVTIQRLELHNHGVIGSQYEAENWLVGSFDRLQRQGRIRVITRATG